MSRSSVSGSGSVSQDSRSVNSDASSMSENGAYIGKVGPKKVDNYEEPRKGGKSGNATKGDGDGLPHDKVYHDKFFSVLFVLYMLGIAAIIAVGFSRDPNKDQGSADVQPLDNDAKLTLYRLLGVIVGIVAVGAVFSLLWVALLKAFTVAIVYLSLILPCILLVGFAILAFAYGLYQLGIVLVILGALNIVWLYLVRNRVPLAVELIKHSIAIFSKYPATAVTAAGSVFVMMVTGVYLIVGVIAVIVGWNGSNQAGAFVLLYLYILLGYYWAFQVIRNVCHITYSGVFGNHVFLSRDGLVPEHNTMISLGRAMTYNFGSACFGALLLAIVQFLRQMARQNGYVGCIFRCILACVEDLVDFFTHFAYVHVALYGTSFCEAGKSTWTLLKACGMTAWINELLVDPALSLTALFCGICTGGIGALWGYFAFINTSASTAAVILGAILGLLIGFGEASVVLQVCHSGISTIFVCIAEQPHAVEHYDPVLYNDLKGYIPAVPAASGGSSA